MSSATSLWFWRSHRLKIAVLLMFAMYCLISMSAALGISIVCMVNSTATASPKPVSASNSTQLGVCGRNVDTPQRSENGYSGDLTWSPTEQSLLFTATYYGSIATSLISGSLADRFGPKRILLGCISTITLISFLAPTIARLNVWAYFSVRILQGAADGFFVPAINSVSGWWFPTNERSTMAALYTSGVQLAGGTSSLIGSRLCGVEWMGGWPLIFYLFGSISLIWIVAFSLIVSDRPADNRWITTEELTYLEKNHVQAAKRPRLSEIPWLSILSSPPFYACLLCNIAFSFCASINVNFLPQYFRDELQLPLTSNGLYTIAPFVSQLFFKNVIGAVADYLKRSGRLHPTTTVKVMQSVGSFGTAALFIALATLPSCDRPWIAFVCLFLFGCIYASCISGFYTSMIVLAPRFTGTITSIAMIFGHLGSASVAWVASLITVLEWSNKWRLIFALGAALQLMAGVVFLLFGSGEVMSWAQQTPVLEREEKRTLKSGAS